MTNKKDDALEALAEQPAHQLTDYSVHLHHCNMGEWEGSCKYSDPDCPALAHAALRAQMAKQPAQHDPSAGTQVSKVWWDGEKLIAKQVSLEDFYKPAQQINPETRSKDGLKYWPNYVAGYNDGLKAAQQQEPVAWAKHTEKKLRFTTMPMNYEDGWRPLVFGDTSPQPSKPLTDELNQIEKDLRFHGLTLVKTVTGYAVLKLGQITAHGIKGDA